MLPFVMLPRPLQESNVIGKGGTAGFLGKAYDPYTLYPDGDDLDMTEDGPDPGRRPQAAARDLRRRGWSAGRELRDAISQGMPELEKAVADYNLDEYYTQALDLIVSGRAREAFDLEQEAGAAARRVRPEHVRPELPAGPAADRSRHAGRRGELAQGGQPDNHSFDTHADLSKRHEGPVTARCSTPACRRCSTDLDQRGMLDETLVVAVGEFGRSPQRGVSTSGNGNSADGRDHWPYCYTGLIAGGGIKRGYVYGKSDKTGSRPGRGPGPPGRAAGDDLPRPRHRPADDRLQPPQPAARAGQGRGGDGACSRRARELISHDVDDGHDGEIAICFNVVYRRGLSSLTFGFRSRGTLFCTAGNSSQPLFREVELRCNVRLASRGRLLTIAGGANR